MPARVLCRGSVGADVRTLQVRLNAFGAGLAADGYTVVDEITLIHRGYEDFHQKLAGLGAVIEMVEDEKGAELFKFRDRQSG